MKIKKQATARHESTQSPMIADFVKATASIPLYQMPAHLASFPKQWPFPRGDTYHWIPALNRFDRILELFNEEYRLVDGPQTQPFERRLLLKGDAEEGQPAEERATTAEVLDKLGIPQDGDRELIEQILNFTRMLLENCGNRSLYSSSGHLDKLLNTTSTSLVKAVLRLGYRLAQRYHAARMRLAPSALHPTLLASHYNFNLDKVLKLAAPFPKAAPTPLPIFATPVGKGKERASPSETDKIDPADLVGLFGLSETALRDEFSKIQLSFYEQSVASGDGPNKATSDEPPATPTPARRTSNLGSNQTPRPPRTGPFADSPVTPSLPSASRDQDRDIDRPGPKVLEIPIDQWSKTSVHQLLEEELSRLPDNVHYELLHKVRISQSLSAGSSGREDAVAIRLLAIANLGYVHPEKEFQQKLGQQDSDEPRRLQLAYQLSELVHPPGTGETGVSPELQTFALNALEALSRHKTKAADVCAALNVNVNHGVLFYVVRKAVAQLADESLDVNLVEDEWREALFALLNCLPTAQPRTGEGMVSAGLLEILVEVLKLRTQKAERNHPKVLNFLDTFVYNLRDAFQALVNAKGLDIIADLIAYEVEVSKAEAEAGKGMPTEYKTQLTDYQIPFYHQQTLRWLFKFLNHMMTHTGGNFDRLMRNLIDSPQLLSGLRTVLSNAPTFGSAVWSMAVTILTSFIHNEPTSYVVIAEAGLSKAFLEAVTQQPIVEPEEGETDPQSSETASKTETSDSKPSNDSTLPTKPLADGILPVAEAIAALPPAYGAICLAEAGMKLFKSSNALSSFFEIFESPAHVKALDVDPDMPTLVGNSFDELVRHHPPLKAQVLSSLSKMINNVVRLCKDRAKKEGAGAKLWVQDENGQIRIAGGRQAIQAQDSLRDADAEDVEMKDADVNIDVTLEQATQAEDGAKGPTTSQYISVVFRFLGGFFANNQLCSSYVESDGVESLLDFATLSCLPYNFNEPGSSSDDFARVVQQLVEQKPHIIVPSLLGRLQRALDQLEPLMKHSGEQGFFSPFTGPGGDADVLKRGTVYAKALVTVHTLCGAMTHTFQSQMYNHRSTHNVFSTINVADLYAHVIDSLGRLHRSCVWEEILLQKNMPAEWEKETRIKGSGFGNNEADEILRFSHDDRHTPEPVGEVPVGEVNAVEGASNNQSSAGAEGNNSSTTSAQHVPDKHSAWYKNTQTLRYLLSKVPTGIAPFFQGLGKLLLFRRSLDTYQKQCAIVVADQLAKAALDQLQFEYPKNCASPEDRYAYWIICLTSTSNLMIDNGVERGYPQALTLVLLCFKDQGGFKVLADIFDSFFESASRAIKAEDGEGNEEAQRVLNLSLGGIKILLGFYGMIINSKLINEASQTTSMQSRPERDRDRPDYFIAAQFLVELRHAVIKPVQKLWDSELIDKATTSIVKTSISILKTVMECETEHGAYKRSENIPKRSKPSLRVWKPRQTDHITRLKDAGYSEDLATEALYRCSDSFSAARDYCQDYTRLNHAQRNPIPLYEIELQKAKTGSPSRAAVVVPAPAEDAPAPTENTEASMEETADGDNVNAEPQAPDSQSVEMEDAASESSDTEEPSSSTPVPPAQVTHPPKSSWDGPSYVKRANVAREEDTITLEDLDEERAKIRKNLIDRSLDILNSHDDVTFELADLISAAVSRATESSSMRAEIGSTLVQSLISLQGDDFRENGKKIAASAHMLALIVQDKDFYEAVVEELKDSFSFLLEFIKIFPDQSADESSPWIGQVLLIMERLLAEDSLPHQIKWTPPTGDKEEDMSLDDLPEPIVTIDNKNQLFDAIMEILPKIKKDESLALSVVRVLVMLTRTRQIALRLAEKRNIQRLFLMVRQLSGVTNESLRSAFMLVLRHIIEDESIIRQIMRSEIQSMFESRERRQTDTTGYTRQMYYLALRAPEIFVEVTNEKLQLARFDPNQRPQTLILKPEEPKPATEENASASDDKLAESVEPKKAPVLERTKTSDLKPPVVENPDGVIHYLLCELLAYKEINDKPEPPKEADKPDDKTNAPQSTAGNSSTPPAVTEPSKTEFKADANPIYIYRCFILKCLAELLQSYSRTKIEFINFSRKADPQVGTPSKPRSGVLNYLLNALVPIGTLNHEGDIAFKKKAATSNCAIDVIVSLCAKTGEHGFPKPGTHQISPYEETEPDLLFVRKFVLEHALKAFRDAAASDEPLDMKYSRLLNISDIFSRMVSQRADGTMLNANAELTPTLKQMAKIMYEKNFITILTTAIADIDLNFPNAKRAVKYILKPLKWLCAVAVDLSTQYDTSATPGSADEYEIETASDDDMVGATREETPDLFRNSTLGMYEPPHESESEPSDDEDEDDMYEDEYADDMDFGEEVPDEDVVSDEDEEMEGMGPIEGLPGDLPMDVEIVVDEDADEIISGDDDDSEDDDDEDDEDEDDDMDDIEEMEEITGDDENGSLQDGDEDEWSDEEGVYDAGDVEGGDLTSPPPSFGDIMQVLDNHEHMLDQIEGEIEMGMDPDDYLEEDMQEEEDEEEEDEYDYDGDDIVYDANPEDDEGMHGVGWGWDDAGPPPHHRPHRINPWMFPSGPNDRILVPAFRSHRPGASSRVADDGMNPLLQRSGRHSSGPSGLPGSRNEGMSDWVHAIEGRGSRHMFTGTPGEGPVSFISNLLNTLSQHANSPLFHAHNGSWTLSLNNMPVGLPPPFDPGFRRDAQRARDHHLSRSTREDPHSSVAFTKAFTGQRWQEEARILYGTSAIEKSQRIVNSILKLMVPPAVEAQKKRQAEKDAEHARKLKEEQERKEQKEREEREAKEKEEREQREREAAEAEARAAEGNAEEQAKGEPAEATEGQAMEGVEEAPAGEESNNAGPSEPTPRITTNIRGRELDITDMGIDLEYLEALPEDLREEVLMQQIQEQRNQGQQNNEEPSDLDREFLNALPPELREELLQQEAQERRRREREEARRRNQASSGAAAVAAPTARAEDMDPASFLASLDPGLRQAVLMEQDEDVLAQLPPEIAVEARALGGDRRLNQFHDYLPPGYRRGQDRRPQPDEHSQKKKTRPCVQMLDKTGVATLLRLMFIPQTGSAKASLNHILRNVCENRQNRAEVISILLSILQDGSADTTAVERSFAQLSLRAKPQGTDRTPKASRKNGGLLSMSTEISPLMVVQQCLHTLWQLTDKNTPVFYFFLTEHETGVGFKSRNNRKGKGKETKATKYPINALLGLLDRKLIIESSSIMEQLTTLLRVITSPLQALKKEKEKAAEEAKQKAEDKASTENSGSQPTAQEPAEARAETTQQDGDTDMTAAPESAPAQPADAEGSISKPAEEKKTEEPKKHRIFNPPDVPELNLRLVSRVLAARECNSKVFQETLSVISNLSPIPGAKEIFGEELVGIAQSLANSTLQDLANLTIQVSKADSPTDVQGMALSKFSPASSDQAKLLRALTALDYLFDPTRDNKDKDKAAVPLEPAQKEDILLTLYENSTFAPLWNKLSECLTVIRQRGNMLNIATILLPLIEALMVVCKNTTLKETPLSKSLPKEFALGSPPPENRMESLFFTFTEEHRKILNDLVHQNPKLMSGTFSLLVKNSKVLEFNNKRNYFNRRLHTRGDRERVPHPPLQLAVRRDQVFLDSFKSLYFKTADEMKYGKLSIRFHGEEGVDAGGVTREWFQVLSRQMFNPDYALFVPVASDRTTFHPNKLSAINGEHLMFFKFIGRIIGKALYEGRVLDCHFSRAVYKRILGRSVNLKDMETLDLEYYKSLQWMLENDITDIITETFSVDVEAFGETQVVDLIENGRNIPVTEENKHEYVRLITEHRLTGSVQEQLENFLKGFHDIVPAELVSIFSEQELELLISGLPDINVDDWKNNTEYHNYTAASPQIQWFWRAVRSFDKEERAKLLQFVTGTSKVPLNGFKELEGMNGFSRFNVHRDYGSKERLPSSHTCFNQLDLPEYETYEDLRKQLYTAMTAGGEYFGFA